MRSARCARASAFLRSDGEERFEIVARVRLERDVRLRPCDPAHLRDPSGHDIGELVMLPRAGHIFLTDQNEAASAAILSFLAQKE